VADLNPRLVPLSEQDFDLAGVDVVVNTHLHFDHCGGNHLFASPDLQRVAGQCNSARLGADGPCGAQRRFSCVAEVEGWIRL